MSMAFCTAFCRYFDVCIFRLLSSLYCSFTIRHDFFCVYIITKFFPSSSRSDHHFFGDSTVPMPLKSSASANCLEADSLLPYFLLSHARGGVILRAYIAIAVGSPCVVSSFDFMDRPS